MKRILHIVGSMNMGGTETFLMNVYRNIDRSKVQFDFVAYGRDGKKDYYEDEIGGLGGKYYKLPSTGSMGFSGIIKELRKILRGNEYAAVHSHTMYNSGFAMIAAKKENVKIRIVHSHTTKDDAAAASFKTKIYNGVMKYFINSYSTMCCACSMAAAERLFNKKAILKKYKFMANAVDFTGYLDADTDFGKVRAELGIDEASVVIGHVGRFGISKNQLFALDAFRKYTEKYNSYAYLLFVGGGDENVRQSVMKKADEYGLSEKVIFAGIRKDIPDIMNCMDVFILPSVYEGLGIVLLEAQVSGLNCVVSENIQPEADLGMNLLHWVDLSRGAEKWADELNKYIGKKITDTQYIKEHIEKSPFRLEQVVEDFYGLYRIGS
ncbi:MAG: glycosyltransferase [Clostridia bacterium]|nr:glycosyltransferase [Clostridia bacterium]